MRKVGFCRLLPFSSLRYSPPQPVFTLSLNSITYWISYSDITIYITIGNLIFLSNFIPIYTTDHFYQKTKTQNSLNKSLLSTYYVLDPFLHVMITAANKTN